MQPADAHDSMKRSSRGYINILRLAWLLVLLHGEFYVFWSAARRCAPWPGSGQHRPEPNADNRLLLVSDPRLKDAYSYSNFVPDAFVRLSEYYSDLYMKRSYWHLQRQLYSQTTTVFLGNLMDGGRQWNDAGFQYHAARFRRLFQVASTPQAQQYHVAGPHDIGFGDGVQSHIIRRFEAEFGPTSYTFQTAHFSVIVVDTLSLSSSLNLSSKDVARSLDLPPQPRVLLTPVPLYRPPHTACAPSIPGGHREQGQQHRALLDQGVSQELLDWIQPVAVFSGSHHQHCQVQHATIPETTVPAFSMSIDDGHRNPGVALVNLGMKEYKEGPGEALPSVASKVCWLPDQAGVYIGYGCLSLVSVVALFLYHLLLHRKTMAKLSTYHHSKRAYKTNSDEEEGGHDSPAPPRPVVVKKWLADFARDVSDIASTTLTVYMACLIWL